MLQKPNHLRRADLDRMAFVVEQNVASHPLGIPLRRFGPAKAGQGGSAQLVEQAGRLSRNELVGQVGHGDVS